MFWNHIIAKHDNVIIETQQKENINNIKEKIQCKENVKNDIEKLQRTQSINSNNEDEKQQKYIININEEMSLFIDNESMKKQDNNKNAIDNINSKINNELLDNKVVIHGYTNFFCILCMSDIKTFSNILTHIKGEAHKSMLKHYLHFNTFEYSTSADTLIVDSSNNVVNVNTNLEYSSSNVNCIPDYNASISTNDMENIEILDTNESNITSQSSLHYCESCKKQIDINNLFESSNTMIHRCNLSSMTMGNDVIVYKCVCCKSVIQENSLLINHLTSVFHINNLVKYLKHTQTSTTNILTLKYIENVLEQKMLPLCTFLLLKIQDACTSCSERCFLSLNATLNIKSSNNIINNVVYHCLFCSAELNSHHNLIVHCQGKMHSSKIKSTDDMDTLTKHVNKLFISNNNENNVKHDNNLIITDDVIKQITKLLSTPLAKNSTSEHLKMKEKSLVECLGDSKWLKVEEKMYTVKHKLNSIKINLRFIIPFNKNNWYCLACKEKVSRETYLLYEHICIESHKIKVCLIEGNTKSKILTMEYLQEVGKDRVMCFPCHKDIKNNIIHIDKHITTSLHINNCKIFTKVIDDAYNCISEELSNLWYSIQRFCCVICTQTFKYNLMFIKHVVESHSQFLSEHKCVFNFCIPCTTLWLDDKDSYTEHCRDITHKYLIKSQDFMIEKLPKSIRNILMQVDDYSNFLFQQTQEILLNDNTQQKVKQSLENILKKKFPTIEAFVFGSRVTGLGLKTSDIDIYLDCGNTYDQNICEALRERNFTIIKRTLYLHEREWEIKDILENSRTPIIKLIYKPTGIKCDISIKNGLSVENSKLIRSFNDAYPPCRKLILFVKKWFSLFNLNETNGLTSYALAWLVIFYLQSRLPEPYLPSVATLIEQNKKSRLICGWETGVAKPKNVNKPKESVSALLMGFLKFYASFDYQHYVICPLMGQRITKRAFAKLVLPMAMNPYIQHLSTSESREYFRIDSPLCVQDPFDLAHNLTKAVTPITLKYFKQYCQDSASILLSLTE